MSLSSDFFVRNYCKSEVLRNCNLLTVYEVLYENVSFHKPFTLVPYRRGWLLIPNAAGADSVCAFCVVERFRRAISAQISEADLESDPDFLSDHTAPYDLKKVGDELSTLIAIVLNSELSLSEPDRFVWWHLSPTGTFISEHHALKVPYCSRCHSLPADNAELAVLDIDDNAGVEGKLRVHPPIYWLDSLKERFVDNKSGIIHKLAADSFGGFAVSSASMTLRRHNWAESGYGRTFSFDESEAIGILEALERYCGVEPSARLTSTFASFDELSESAFDPRLFGSLPTTTYDDSSNWYEPFSPEVKYRWVWGNNLTNGKMQLVPEDIAYYYVAPDTEISSFVFEVSNGCALGGSPSEAVLHGLFEVIERDSFLMSWYRQCVVAEIKILDSDSFAFVEKWRFLEAEFGMDIRFFDITFDSGVPCVFAVAFGDMDPQKPAQICAAGVGPTMFIAVQNSLNELAPFLANFCDTFSENADRAHLLAEDFSLVKLMPDHSTLFGSYKMRKFFRFLDDVPTRFLAEYESDSYLLHGSYADRLKRLLSRLRDNDQQCLVVDQTAPEFTLSGLCCVKVLLSNSLTMTFGHSLRRVDGIPRLFTVPESLGLTSGSPSFANLVPRPFP